MVPLANSTIDKMSQTREEELQVEGGGRMPDLDYRTIPSSADIVGNLATMRRSVGKRKVRQNSQDDNSQITPQISNMTIMVKYS